MARGFGALADFSGGGGQKSARKSGPKSGVRSARKSGPFCGPKSGPRANATELISAYRHFERRCGERFGLSREAALAVWRGAVAAFFAGEFQRLCPVARIEGPGRRVFAWALADGRVIFILFDCDRVLPLTALVEGMGLRGRGGGVVRLSGPGGMAGGA
jgi:hypothetical protein